MRSGLAEFDERSVFRVAVPSLRMLHGRKLEYGTSLLAGPDRMA
jgi:hypothetical protein